VSPSRAAEFEERLGYRFREPRWLERALTHDSHAHENRSEPGSDYEALEFLGDALLGFLVSDLLFRAEPTSDEGVLTRRRQEIVNGEALAGCAREMGLGDVLRLGRGEASTGGRQRASILADGFESVLAAIYLDGGLRPARAFVRRHLGGRVRDAGLARGATRDFKTRFQEAIQASHGMTPRYRLVRAEGPAHARTFVAEVWVGDEVSGRGEGPSVKSAEQEAARAALLGLGCAP
jgi:ribonuclease-3